MMVGPTTEGQLAIRLSTKVFSCSTPSPRAVGTNRVSTVRNDAAAASVRPRGQAPARRSAQALQATCRMPAMSTAQAIDRNAEGPSTPCSRAPAKAPATMPRLRMMGAAAVGAKTPRTCSTAPTSATRQTIGMYGSMMAMSSCTSSASWRSSRPSTASSSTMPAPASTVMPTANRPKTIAESARALAGSSRSRRAYSGRNAALSAPSPKRRRKRFGSWNAKKNASVKALIPNRRLIAASRASPVTRLAIVIRLTVRESRSSDPAMW